LSPILCRLYCTIYTLPSILFYKHNNTNGEYRIEYIDFVDNSFYIQLKNNNYKKRALRKFIVLKIIKKQYIQTE